MSNLPVEDLLRSELWVLPDYNADDIKQLVQQLDNCNKAVSAFCSGQIDEETFLDILEANGHDMDDFLAVTDSNLILVGL